MTHRRAALVLPAIALLAATPVIPVSAQSTRDGEPPATPTASVEIVELDDAPYAVDSLGLRMRLPINATASGSELAGKTVVQVTPTDRTWLLNIQGPRTSSELATPSDVIERTLAELRAPRAGGNAGRAEVLERIDNLVIADLPAPRAYVRLERSDGPAVVQGYTVVKTTPSQFIVFELITTEPLFAKARGAYERTVASATFLDPAAIQSERAAAVRAGLAFFEQLSPEDLDGAVGAVGSAPRWYRLSRPAPTGAASDAEELGYRAVRAWKGRRAEIESAPTDRPTEAEAREGYLFEIVARLVQRTGIADRWQVIDTRAVYFMTPDRRDEAWSVRTGLHDGKASQLYTETGARSGNSMTISVQAPPQSPRQVRPLMQGEGYISQLEAQLLPTLLLRAPVAGEYGFYAYQSARETVSLRRDRVAPDDASGGAWVITTSYRETEPPQRAIYRADGTLLRVELADGAVWEPIEADELKRLWQLKGLPLEAPTANATPRR